MSTPSKYTRMCPECQRFIVAGRDSITKLHPQGAVWVHEECHTNFWLSIKDDKLRQEERENQAHDLFEQENSP